MATKPNSASDMKDKLERLYEHLRNSEYGGQASSKQQLIVALYDWNIEKNWSKSNCFVLSYQDKGFIFFAMTQNEPRHCTLRHVFVLEEFRGEGIGRKLMLMMNYVMQKHNVGILRFFAIPPSIPFYEKLGFQWHGLSKSGYSFYYGDTRGNLMKLPPAQYRYLVKRRDDGT